MPCQPAGGGEELWLAQEIFVTEIDSLACKHYRLSGVNTVVILCCFTGHEVPLYSCS